MKVNFSEQTALINKTFTFAEMATLEDLLQTAALESFENSDGDKTLQLISLADSFGIDIGIEAAVESDSEMSEELGNSDTGQDSGAMVG